MYFLPVWCSLLCFIVSACFGKHLGSRGVYLYSIVSILFCNIVCFYIFYEVCLSQSTCKVEICDWIRVDFLTLKWSFYFDSLSATMLIVINVISLCAQIYSIEYMREDPHSIRFFSYLSLFTFFMVFLVLSDNMLQLFMGWEGVGICSYLLINFWSTRIQANKASILAVITNKIGDIALLICCAIFYYEYKSLDFSILFSCVHVGLCSSYEEALMVYSFLESDDSYDRCNLPERPLFFSLLVEEIGMYTTYFEQVSSRDSLSVICFFLVLAAIGKSAQAGLHIWLPEAMEGPTPVSSLIHAATMVTAGIFLLVRCSYFFSDSHSMFVFIIFVGSITAFFSSTIGLLQTDIKKVVAYSTCSQLGYMFVCCGFSAYNNSIFHLFNHAFFKALLFLTAGYIIHALSNEQDIRKMGGLLHILPFSYLMMFIGSLSLIGFPFFSGFYSKDKIIELCFNNTVNFLNFISIYKYIVFSQSLCLFAVIFTLIYSIKLLFFVFLNSYNGFKLYILNIHFSSFFIKFPLFFLSVLSITSGYITSDMMVGVGSNFWLKSIQIDSFFYYNSDKSFFLLHTEYNPYIRQITLVWTIYFFCVSLFLLFYFKTFFYYNLLGSLSWFRNLFIMINKKYLFINRLLIFTFIRNSFSVSYNYIYILFDKGFIEFVGPFGIVSSIKNVLFSQSKLQSGLIYHYSGFLFLMLIFLLHFFFDLIFY